MLHERPDGGRNAKDILIVAKWVSLSHYFKTDAMPEMLRQFSCFLRPAPKEGCVPLRVIFYVCRVQRVVHDPARLALHKSRFRREVDGRLDSRNRLCSGGRFLQPSLGFDLSEVGKLV